jgi:hypothetical protein
MVRAIQKDYQLEEQLPSRPKKEQATQQAKPNALPTPGHSLLSDFNITGPNIFSDVSWKNTKVPGQQGQQATGLGVLTQFSVAGNYFDIMIPPALLNSSIGRSKGAAPCGENCKSSSDKQPQISH